MRSARVAKRAGAGALAEPRHHCCCGWFASSRYVGGFPRKNHKRLIFAQHRSNGGKRRIATRPQKAKHRVQIGFSQAPEESKAAFVDLRTINLNPLTRLALGFPVRAPVLSETGARPRRENVRDHAYGS